jgi:hypothetical protein
MLESSSTMASTAPASVGNNNKPAPIPFGYFKCRKRISLLNKFQNLIRHRERWPGDLLFAAPLATLIPEGTKPEYEFRIINHEITKLLLPVSFFVHDAGVNTLYTYKKQKLSLPFQLHPEKPEFEVIQVDVIQHYFDIDDRSINRRTIVDIVMRVLDQSIGAYELRKEAAFWELFNPAVWCANLIHLPMWILTRAGFAPSQKFYEQFIKALMIIILGAIAARLGLVTWKDLVSHLLR